MPPMPPAGMAGAGCSDFFSARTHSVVRNIEAIEAAFSRATRDTFVGSMIPALSMSSYLSSRALYPKAPSPSRTLFTTTEPSPPALATIWRSGSSIARLTIWIPVV